MILQDLLAAALAAGGYLTGKLGPSRRRAAARLVSRLTRAAAPSKWRAVRDNLSVINAWSGASFTPEKVFENFAVTLSDFITRAPCPVRVAGREKVEQALARGRGAVFVTSHLGHWELGGKVLEDWGWPATAVYQPYGSPFMRRLIQSRRAQGLRYLAVGRGAAAGVSAALGRSEIVAMLGDRPFGEEGHPAPLCGRTARLPRGPFLLACRSAAPVIPGFVLREGDGAYAALVEDPLWPEGHGPGAFRAVLEKTARVLERYLARHGDQWYCFEPVWEL